MCVWNPQANIGFQFTTFWSPPATSSLPSPKYVRAIRGKKTDKRDAKWIADIFKHDLVSGSFIPPADIRQLRDLVRYRWKLTNFTTGEKNRAQNCLTVSNIILSWMMCLRTCLERPLLQLRHGFLKIQPRKLQMSLFSELRE